MSTTLRRVLREPAVHFVALGGLLCALAGLPRPAERAPFVLSAARVGELQAGFAARWGRPPDQGELTALVEQTVDEELLEREARRLALDLGDQGIRQRLVRKMRAVAADPALGEDALYAQALALGLDDDVVIRRQLRQKMRLLLQRDPAAAPFTDAELADALERHRERFVQSATVTFTQVFLGSGERARERALEIRTRSLTPEDAARLADAFPLAARANASTRVDVARRFGAGFADVVMALPSAAWSAPVASPYGLHLVWVHERRPAGVPPLATVRGQVARILEDERAAARESDGLRRLRDLYRVRVEWPEVRLAEAGP